jgi:intracellular sulfur oxidation DsrE/DsrF family protein
MRIRILLSLLTFLLLVPGLSSAADRKMVIQITSQDPVIQKMALNSAKNLKKLLGKDTVDVEVVVYGPGITLLKSSGRSADKVKSLMTDYGVNVSVCDGRHMQKDTADMNLKLLTALAKCQQVRYEY